MPDEAYVSTDNEINGNKRNSKRHTRFQGSEKETTQILYDISEAQKEETIMMNEVLLRVLETKEKPIWLVVSCVTDHVPKKIINEHSEHKCEKTDHISVENKKLSIKKMYAL